ncbi:MAG: serine/threonine protein kinase [Scytolyngbya sp. HA4215-MV1]|jgi:serine/threonine protein kinase|nr:serine/threonine protein kinase [Scytolyngbya sp. HA4215-MV1]
MAKILDDRYEVQQRLSRGEGKGTVLARDLITQELVVIKLLVYRSSFESKELKLFQREAETLKALNHPLIPRYLDYFELNFQDGKGLGLVQTYIEGKSLRDLLKAGQTLTEAEAKQIATSVLDLLIYLHNQQPPIIHRDIKPSNLLIRPQGEKTIGQVYLIDFSSAQNFLASAKGSFTVVGTYGYTAPEQVSGRPITASDLYSLGATLLNAMTNQDPARLPRKGRRIEFEHLTQCSPAFADWLGQMIAPALDQRFSSAREALQVLESPPSQGVPPLLQKPIESKIVLTKGKDSLTLVIPTGMGKLRLHIDDRQLILSNELLGWKYKQTEPLRRKDLRRLEVSPSQILIWGVIQKHELGNGLLTEAETHWLAHELSQYLHLPITQVQDEE